MCAMHRWKASPGQVGERITQRTAYEAVRDLRCDLRELQIPNANAFTLKAFRAGRATEMANSGDGLAAILQAGEWSSPALLKYISETELDKKKFLASALMNGDDDEC